MRSKIYQLMLYWEGMLAFHKNNTLFLLKKTEIAYL
jgi:hypothetical protein